LGFESRVTHCSQSDVGLAREENEDSLGWMTPEESGRGWLFIVADGMGGAAAGSAASTLAVKTVKSVYPSRIATGADTFDAIRDAVESANLAILDHAQTDDSLRGMGTTITVLAVVGDQAYTAHVGDSRIYRYRGGRLEQMSRDHTRVQMLADQGIITPAEAQDHPESHVISRNLGGKPELEVDIPDDGPFPLREGDLYLLCSDGLHGLVGDPAIDRVMGLVEPARATPSLIQLANRRGGYDNITVSLVCLGEGPWEAVTDQELGAVIDELAYDAVSDTALFDAYDPEALSPVDFETRKLRAVLAGEPGAHGPTPTGAITTQAARQEHVRPHAEKAARAGLKNTVSMVSPFAAPAPGAAPMPVAAAPPPARKGMPVFLLVLAAIAVGALLVGIVVVVVLLNVK
jgi:PPM family protein phosphatase